MVLTESAAHPLGSPAQDFSLIGVDGKTWGISDFIHCKALVVIFMCNHCPYVIAVQDRVNQLAITYKHKSVGVVGINSNDPVMYPADNYHAMQERAREQNYQFPYLQDETQDVARAYGAVCTPDPFVYENVGQRFVLRYQGRIDDNWKSPEAVTRRELAAAVEAILSGKPVDSKQLPSLGCSIKWKKRL